MGIWSAKKRIDKSRNYGFSWSIAGFIETVIPVCLGEPTWNLDLGFDLASCWQIPMNQHVYPWTSTIPGAFFRQLTTWMVSAGSWRLSELSVPTGCEWFSSEVWLVQDLYCISGWWWLEPWNFIFPYIGNNHSNHPNIYIIIYICLFMFHNLWDNHPNRRTYIFQRGRAQPPTRYGQRSPAQWVAWHGQVVLSG